jgi:hypothetical protein|tara:strand:- start:452 stop:673 length:222 start_codon:yes stop_codon:yes gene_type:complete
MVRRKKKLFEIKVYEFNVNEKRFFRAESSGFSVPSRTIKGAINNLLKDLNWYYNGLKQNLKEKNNEKEKSKCK